MTMCDEMIEQQTLASAPGLGSITLCPCGTISLHVGGISVRMELSAFLQTGQMYVAAMASLEQQAQTLQAAPGKNQSRLTH
jgi:hypothetical protein